MPLAAYFSVLPGSRLNMCHVLAVFSYLYGLHCVSFALADMPFGMLSMKEKKKGR